MEVEQRKQSGIPGMWTGKGDESYAKNSEFQGVINTTCFSSLSELLRKLKLPAAEEGPLVVADLGCSSGPNTIHLVTKVVELLRDRYISSGRQLPEFQGCFSDLPVNDFNTLFELITSESGGFFVSGIPASCFGRLLPRSSVQVFTCNHTLHWMSQVPAAVLDPDSPAYNGNRIWLEGCSSIETIKAYKQQALTDLRNFLSARAAELSPGGVLSCVFAGAISNGESSTESTLLRPLADLKDPQDSTKKTLWRIMEHALQQMASEGILTSEKRAAINLPFCFFAEEEVLEVLTDYSKEFHVEKLESQSSMKFLMTETKMMEILKGEPEPLVRILLAVLGPFFKANLGEDLFRTFTATFTSLVSHELEKDNFCKEFVFLHMLLLRK